MTAVQGRSTGLYSLHRVQELTTRSFTRLTKPLPPSPSATGSAPPKASAVPRSSLVPDNTTSEEKYRDRSGALDWTRSPGRTRMMSLGLGSMTSLRLCRMPRSTSGWSDAELRTRLQLTELTSLERQG